MEYRMSERYSYLIEKENKVWNVYQVWYTWVEEGIPQRIEKRDKFPIEFTTKKAAAEYCRINLRTEGRH